MQLFFSLVFQVSFVQTAVKFSRAFLKRYVEEQHAA
jgi:hypothetical protein